MRPIFTLFESIFQLLVFKQWVRWIKKKPYVFNSEICWKIILGSRNTDFDQWRLASELHLTLKKWTEWNLKLIRQFNLNIKTAPYYWCHDDTIRCWITWIHKLIIEQIITGKPLTVMFFYYYFFLLQSIHHLKGFRNWAEVAQIWPQFDHVFWSKLEVEVKNILKPVNSAQ